MKRKFLLLAVFFMLLGSVFFVLKAQEIKVFDTKYVMAPGEEELQEEAEWYFYSGNYVSALSCYLKLDARYQGVIEYTYFAGICYLYKPDEQEKAVGCFQRAYKERMDLPDIEYYLGKANLQIYNYDDAAIYFKLAQESENTTEKNRKKTDLLIQQCKNGKELIKASVEGKVQIENVGRPVNSVYAEYVPLISSDESVLIFTYKGVRSKGGKHDDYGDPDPEGEYYEDIFFSTKVDDKWVKPKDIGYKINTNFHDASIALSPDGHQLFIYKDNNGGDIYISQLEGKIWSEPVKLEGEVNTKNWEGSASLSADGKTLYFSSDRPKGLGKKDIYKATLQKDRTWGEVKNLGPDINTAYNDDAPFIHVSDNLLFFSSEGHYSMGGYDIFHSTLVNSEWTNPVNVGYPVNTANDDIFYVVSANCERGYFSSGRKGGLGDRDIFITKPGVLGKKPVLALVKGIIKYKGRNAGSIIHVVGKKNDKSYGDFRSNSATGKYLVVLPPGKEYVLDFEIKGKSVHKEFVDVRSIDELVEINLNIELSKKINPLIASGDFIQKELDKKVMELATIAAVAALEDKQEEETTEEVAFADQTEVELEVKMQVEEAAGKEAEEEAQMKAEEEARKAAAEEAAEKKAEEEAQKQAESEVKKQAEEAVGKVAEEEVQMKAEEETGKASEEESQMKVEEEAKKTTTEEAAKKMAEEEAQTQAELEAKKQAEEIAGKVAEEEARMNAEEKTKKTATEEAAKKTAEEEAQKQAESEAKKQAEEVTGKVAEEEARMKAEEEDIKTATEEVTEEAAEKMAEEEALKQVEETVTAGKEPKPRTGNTFKADNILFDFAKVSLKQEALRELDQLSKIMKNHTSLTLEISGHACSIGKAEANQIISEKRAKIVFDYLRKNGINESRMDAKGYGETRPIASNTLPDGSDNSGGRMKNRRVELEVMGIAADMDISSLEKLAQQPATKETVKKATSGSDRITASKAVICSSVKNRTPVGEGKVFKKDIGRICFFTNIRQDPGVESSIFHVWYYKDKQMAKVKLHVKGPRWRTYSSKAILPSWTGKWHVDVVTSGDKVIDTAEFTIE